MLSEFFAGKVLNKSIHPDEAVAYGAAVQAAILTGVDTAACTDIVLLDVTPLSLGLELKGGLMDVVIPRNTTIPKRITKTYYTTEDGQSQMDNDIFQGERAMAKDNHCIAKSVINGVTPMKAGEVKVKETFDIDANGILNVYAYEQGNDKAQVHITVNTNKSRLSSEQVKKMQEEADKYKAEDAMHVKRVHKRNEIEQEMYDIKNMLRDDDERGGRFSEDEVNVLGEVYKRGMDYLYSNPKATIKELMTAQEKAQEKLSPIFAKYNLYSMNRRGARQHDDDEDEEN
jgi:heat shock protein 1/8